MNEFYDIVFTGENVVCLGTAAAALALIPLIFWLVWHLTHKGQLKLRFLLVGALGFFVSARILEVGLHLLCIVSNNPVSRFINGNTVAYVLYGITAAGVFEEVGRHLILKYFLLKDRTRENAVLYGIGHAGIEVWVVALPAIALEFVIAAVFSSKGVPEALSALNITETSAASALPAVQAAAKFGTNELLLNVLERFLTMFVHIGLTVIVYYGVSKEKKGFLPLAILLHMIVDLFPAMYQRGILSVWVCEAWLAAWAAAIGVIAVSLYRKSNKAEEA